MKFVDEYHNKDVVERYVQHIHATATRPWTIMEICGGQTHSIVRNGIEALLPRTITLVHGPGCPVCVTPLVLIDKAILLASRPEIIFASFGDMLRVPGSAHDLLSVKAAGGDVRMVYSPLDALTLAERNPEREIVFFAIGFETTAPANAMVVVEAKRRHLENFSILSAHVLVPPAIEVILSSASNRVQGILAAGHVCAVMGYEEYRPIAEKYHTPIVVTGFEPVDILRGVDMLILMLEEGRIGVENAYGRAVRAEGNKSARSLMQRVFEPTDREWRGIGGIPQSGLRLRDEFSEFDAELRFELGAVEAKESPDCIAGHVLQGRKRPQECPLFARACTPDHPVGAPMVSSEGACAAYVRYHTYQPAPMVENNPS